MEEVSSVLGLFCLCYSHTLITLDDDEFFKRQTCFSLKEVLFMSLSLKVTLSTLHRRHSIDWTLPRQSLTG
jgi:hypothetical protein